MKPFLLLIIVFAVYTTISKFITGNWNLPFGGNLAMCLMLCFTAMGHFMYTKGMSMMIPSFIPYKMAMIYGSGIFEIILALGLLFLPIRPYIGYALIIFFIVITPANIYAATRHIDIEKATLTGPTIKYLWFRIPLQLLFIGWVYYFSIRTH